MNVRREVGRAVRALPGLVLSRSGPTAALTRRNWLFDLGLAAALALIAIISYDHADDARFIPPEPGDPGPGGPDPGGVARPARPMVPFPPGAEAVDHQSGLEWASGALLLVFIAAPLIFRRRYPLSVLWVVLATAAFIGDDDRQTLRLSFFVGVVAAYSAAVYSPYRLPALASLPVAALLFGELQQGAARPALGETITSVPEQAVPFLILVPLGIAAYGLRSWRARADAEGERAAELEREVRRAAEQERSRIARELHDVVTHNVSVMVIQAGAARKVLEVSPGDAREALLAVEASGRAAMTELRHVMGLLTMDDEALELAPQPGMDQLEALVGRVRDAGLPVELIVTGDRGRSLPDGVDLAGYRVAQEALTNAVKHAEGASAIVRVDYGTDRLWIEVTDTGGRRPATADPGSGKGLIGLRERLALYSGTLTAGPRLRGGYRVEAIIPLTAAAPAAVASADGPGRGSPGAGGTGAGGTGGGSPDRGGSGAGAAVEAR
ncbi:sensor histidine kinase [Cryptosporangium arvum]|uniref:sensor histidine kinase n=1 Tax=Cryptosporangium arvum TaxID=80871 RepID=UPI0004BADFDC|nr:histidine kinase [Cryptosporangium arvum]